MQTFYKFFYQHIQEIFSIIGAFIITIGSYTLGTHNASRTSGEPMTEQKDEKIESLEEIKKDLNEDIISIMKAKDILLDNEQEIEDQKIELRDNELSFEEVLYYNLSNIYVFDASHDDIYTCGTSPCYAYRYHFILNDRYPTEDEIQILNSFSEYGYLHCVWNTDSYLESLYVNEKEGYFVMEKSEESDNKIPFVEPLINYLDNEEIKESYTAGELYQLFLRINSRDNTLIRTKK